MCVCSDGCVHVCVGVVCTDTVATAKPSRTQTKKRCIIRMVMVCLTQSLIITNNGLDLIKVHWQANIFHPAESLRSHMTNTPTPPSLSLSSSPSFYNLLLFLTLTFPPHTSVKESESLKFPWLIMLFFCPSVLSWRKVLHWPSHIRRPLPSSSWVCQRNWSFQDQNRENYRFRYNLDSHMNMEHLASQKTCKSLTWTGVCFRGIWRGMLWAYEAPRKKRHPRGSEDSEGRKHGETEEGLPGRGFHYGTVWPPQRHSPGGSGDAEYAYIRVMYTHAVILGFMAEIHSISVSIFHID